MHVPTCLAGLTRSRSMLTRVKGLTTRRSCRISEGMC
jgi:hypothetical protein